jgi:hypothetical protein
MISNPYKIQYLEANKNFSFRPINQIKKENIKLKPFVTDKTRVEKYLKIHQAEHEKYKKHKNNNFISIDDNNKLNQNNNENGQRCCSENNIIRNNSISSTNIDKYLQPIMKFKPRTDLERIFDSINLNYYGKIDRNVINEQLKSLGLVTVYNEKSPTLQDEYSLLREKLKVNPEILNYLIKEKRRLEKGPRTKEIDEAINNMENIININKGILSDNKKTSYISKSQKAKDFRNKRRNMKNFLAKNILSEYQRKTHFKALCTCSLEISDSHQKKSMNLENNKDLINRSEDKYYSYNNTLYNTKIKDNDDSIKNWKCNCINLCKKQFHKKKQYSNQELDYLKNLFTRQIDTRGPFGGGLNAHKKNNEDDELNKYLRHANIILVNGKYYNKNDLKGISNAVLKECNFIRKCFEAENAGEGKTMITRGMTVNEFTKKYGLPK